MEVLTIEGVKIAGIEAEVPSRELDAVESIRPLYGAKAESVVQATGIKTICRTENESVIDLCVKAAERLIAKVDKSEIGAIVFVSFTTPKRMPAAACEAQTRLGLGKGVMAVDINLACSGWGYGLYLAGLTTKNTGKKTLLLAGDVQSAYLDKNDVATMPVLADAGSATIVDKGEDTWKFAFLSEGAEGEALTLKCGGTIKMDGFKVFKFVASEVSEFIGKFIEQSDDKFDMFVPHQANGYMVRELAKALKIAPDKVAVSVDKLGNSASATIPVTIAKGRIKGEVLASGFGGGLSAFVARIRI